MSAITVHSGPTQPKPFPWRRLGLVTLTGLAIVVGIWFAAMWLMLSPLRLLMQRGKGRVSFPELVAAQAAATGLLALWRRHPSDDYMEGVAEGRRRTGQRIGSKQEDLQSQFPWAGKGLDDNQEVPY